MQIRVIWDDQAPERAAIWYLGAFGAVGAVLLAGASIAGVDWTHANHPVYTLLLVVAAVVAAFTVVTVASLVIYPGCTSVALRNRQNKVGKRIRRKTGATASGAITWDQVAAEDNGVLAALYVDAAFQDSPDTLWAGAHGRGNSRQAARDQTESNEISGAGGRSPGRNNGNPRSEVQANQLWWSRLGSNQ